MIYISRRVTVLADKLISSATQLIFHCWFLFFLLIVKAMDSNPNNLRQSKLLDSMMNFKIINVF